MKIKICSGMLAIMSLLALPFVKIEKACASEQIIDKNCVSYVLMDKDSGKMLQDYNANKRVPVASVIKLMTILLTLESIEAGNLKLEDKIAVSENASGMGGSQIFLDANQEYQAGELLKSVIVCSANDSSVALAEHIGGSEQMFVKQMNKKAKDLGLTDTNYENCTGLPTTNQYSCAKDVALVLRQVLDYDVYQQYSKIWLEDFVHPSGRTTEMTNTNKLSRFYEGCLGGKTGSTNEAKYCLGVGAKRNNTSLIAVVLGSETSKERFFNCANLLNYGFAHYENEVLVNEESVKDVQIKMKGQKQKLSVLLERESNIVKEKGVEIKVDLIFNLPDSMTKAKKNEVVGEVDVIVNGEKYDTVNLLAANDIDEPSFLDYLEIIEEDFV